MFAFAVLVFSAVAPKGTSAASNSSATLIQSASGTGDRLAQKADQAFVPDFAFSGPTIDVTHARDANLDQEICGFGGAFTEAASLVFKGLSTDEQQRVLQMYFSTDGLGYTLGRVHMNSCDFSPKSYSFDDVAGDFSLKHFEKSVAHDREAMIPFMHAAQALVQGRNKTLRLIAAPWSPPAWMKTSGRMDGSKSPGLRQDCHAVWAEYFAKWIEAYKKNGIQIWAFTPQNEPENAAQWEACVYSAQQEMDFIAKDLGPTLKREHPEVKIFAFDHNKDHVHDWAAALYSHPDASQYVDGVAFHWYSGDQFDNVQRTHTDFPQATLLMTEATYERYRWHPNSTVVSGDWSFGEGYAHDILGDLKAGACGWIDWNLILDTKGGPNHVNNVCDASMLADVKKNEVYVHPQYYFIGHFSKYLLPGSRRLRTDVLNSRSYQGKNRGYGTCTSDDGLQAVSVVRPDLTVATVVLNCGDAPISFKLRDGVRALHAQIPAHAIQTYLFSQGPAAPDTCSAGCLFDGQTHSCKDRVAFLSDKHHWRVCDAISEVNKQCTSQCSCEGKDFGTTCAAGAAPTSSSGTNETLVVV